MVSDSTRSPDAGVSGCGCEVPLPTTVSRTDARRVHSACADRTQVRHGASSHREASRLSGVRHPARTWPGVTARPLPSGRSRTVRCETRNPPIPRRFQGNSRGTIPRWSRPNPWATPSLPFRCSGLDAEGLTNLVRGMRVRRFRRGETVFHVGDPGDALFIVMTGAIKITLPPTPATRRSSRRSAPETSSASSPSSTALRAPRRRSRSTRARPTSCRAIASAS